MTQKSRLMGYVRKDSNHRGKLRFSIDKESLMNAECFKSGDGREFVSLYCNADKVSQIIHGEREVTSIVQLTEE